MAKIAIVFGILIALISPVSLVAVGHFSKTGLIPAGFGLVLVVAGLLALNPKFRMHAMHLAALVGLIGTLGGLGMSIPKLLGSAPLARPAAVYSQLAMGLLSAVFVALAVRSFIAARRNRVSAA